LHFNRLTAQAPGDEPIGLELRSELVPMPYGKLLSGPVGYMHMDGCLFNAVEAAALRAASRALSKPARSVGSSTWAGTAAVQLFQVSRLLVKHGRFVSRVRHDEAHLPAGTVLPQRQDIDLDGTALSFQRPLVVLIGPRSVSGAESFAGPMQAYGRATLVGEQTAADAGLCGR
jgi:hypothetical protein